jgi:uncharacterized protein
VPLPPGWTGGVVVQVPEGPTPLAPKVTTLWRIQAMGWVVGALSASLVISGLVGLTASATLLVTLLVLALGVGLGLWLPTVAYRRWRYELTDDALELAHGVVVRTESTIPHFRVQHVDVHQGPLERWLGIARLEIATASSASDAEVPGVEVALAEPIRRHVLERSQSGDAV